MPARKKNVETPEAKIAKKVAEIHKELEAIDKIDVFSQDFKNFIKREHAHLKWRHPDLLK